MILARFIAIVLLLQGLGPVFLFPVWHPEGWFLVGLAAIYTLLALGFWQGQRWTLPLTLALTLPQLFAVSSPWLSWRFSVGASWGFGVLPAATLMQTSVFGYHGLGDSLNYAFGYNHLFLVTFASIGHRPCVLFNVLAVPLVALLLFHFANKLIAAEFSPVPNSNCED